MTENNSSTEGHPALLDFTTNQLDRSSDYFNLRFNEFQFAFAANGASMALTPPNSGLEFRFDFTGQYQLREGKEVIVNDLKDNKLKHITGTTMLLSFMLFLNTADLDQRQLRSIQSAVSGAAGNAVTAVAVNVSPNPSPGPNYSALLLAEGASVEDYFGLSPQPGEPPADLRQSPLEEPVSPPPAAAANFLDVEMDAEISAEPSARPKALLATIKTIPEVSKAIEEELAIKESKIIEEAVENHLSTQKEVVSPATDKVAEAHKLHHDLLQAQSKAVAHHLAPKLSRTRFCWATALDCAPCKMMEKGTFQDTAVKEYLSDHYVMKKIDVDDFDGFNLKQHYNIKLLPTFLVLDENGKVMARYEESFSASRMVDMLSNHVNNHTSAVKPVTRSRQLGPQKTAPTAMASVDIVSIELQKNRKGKKIDQIRNNGRNWNFTQVQFKIAANQLPMLKGGKIVVRIESATTGQMLSEVSMDSFSSFNTVRIAHPWTKNMDEGYAIKILHRQSDGSTSQLINGSKSITTNYDPVL
ncbi:MAG: thioredoxin family protein [Bacteroidota bacterium]